MKGLDWLQSGQKWAYFVVVGAVSTALIFLSIPFKAQFQYEYRLGQIWLEDDLISPIDFSLPKSEEEYFEDRLELYQSCDFYYDYLYQIDNWKKDLGSFINDDEVFVEWQERGVIGTIPNKKHLTFFSDGGLLDVSEAITPSTIKAKYGLPDTLTIEPTLKISSENVDSALVYRAAALTRSKGFITRGTPIIIRGAAVTQEKFNVLKALEANFDGRDSEINLISRVGALVYILLIVAAIAFYLNQYDPQIIAHSSSLNLYMFVIAGASIATFWSASIIFLNPFVVPLVLVPVLLRSFFNDRLALVSHVLLLLLVAPFISGAVHFMVVQFTAGLITLFNIRGIYKRSQLFQSTLVIMAAVIVAHVSIYLIRQIEWSTEAVQPLVSSLIGVLVLLFIFPLIYFFERIFRVVSDLTLLELSDTNNPLLKRLSKEAPGTFQHTMQVANLAEYATELVGGNTLLVRTGALYHDIGKIANPQYFTENQTSSASPHDELSYLESAEIIIGHVTDGIELAKKQRLPDIVVDFIRTHHGTSRVEYFYRKFKEDHPDASQFESFQYPGPKPFSKETAIVMMSDAVEASTRSLPEKTQSNLNEMIDKVIDHQLTTGQYNNADITLKDINTIREAFKKFIRGVYHVRIEYPKE